MFLNKNKNLIFLRIIFYVDMRVIVCKQYRKAVGVIRAKSTDINMHKHRLALP